MAEPPQAEGQIYLLANECESLFTSLTTWEHTRVIHSLIFEYQQRFATWTAYLGVFARPSQCLDRRLQGLPDIRDIVLRLLDSLGRSLTIFTRPPNDVTSSETITTQPTDESLQLYQRALSEVEETLERLNRLGVTIRQSTRLGLDYKAKAFAEKLDLKGIDDLFSLSVQTLYPKAHPELRNRLSTSMSHRYAKMIFLKSRQVALSTRREQKRPQLPTIDEDAIATLEISTPSLVGATSIQPAQPRPPSVPSLTPLSSVDTIVVRQRIDNQSVHGPKTYRTSSVFINQGRYPNPPRKKDNDSVICDWCSQRLGREDLDPKNWSRHVDHDLKPYLCFMEECTEASFGFPTFDEWFNHMQLHGQCWHQEAFQLPTWICSLCENHRDGFGDPQKLFEHMKQSHNDQFSIDQLESISQHSRVFKPRPADECPLCGLRIQEAESSSKTTPLKRQIDSVYDTSHKRARLTNNVAISYPNTNSDNSKAESPGMIKTVAQHIASHLQSLMFLTISIASVQSDETFDQDGTGVGSDVADSDRALVSSQDEDVKSVVDLESLTDEHMNESREVASISTECYTMDFLPGRVILLKDLAYGNISELDLEDDTLPDSQALDSMIHRIEELINITCDRAELYQTALLEFKNMPPQTDVGKPDGGRTEFSRPEGTGEVQGVTKKKYRRHPKPDEYAPERPPSAYVLFSNKIREDLKSQNLSFTKIAKLIGENWQSLPKSEKEAYESQANVNKEKYHRELMEYKKTPEYKKYMEYLQEFREKQAKHEASDASKRFQTSKAGAYPFPKLQQHEPDDAASMMENWTE